MTQSQKTSSSLWVKGRSTFAWSFVGEGVSPSDEECGGVQFEDCTVMSSAISGMSEKDTALLLEGINDCTSRLAPRTRRSSVLCAMGRLVLHQEPRPLRHVWQKVQLSPSQSVTCGSPSLGIGGNFGSRPFLLGPSCVPLSFGTCNLCHFECIRHAQFGSLTCHNRSRDRQLILFWSNCSFVLSFVPFVVAFVEKR